MRLGVRKTTDRISIVADLSDRSTDYRRIKNRKNRFYLNLLEKHLCPQTLGAKESIHTQGGIARLAIKILIRMRSQVRSRVAVPVADLTSSCRISFLAYKRAMLFLIPYVQGSLQFPEYLPEILVEDDLGVAVLRGGITVHDDQVLAAEVVRQGVGRIYGQRGAADDEYISFGEGIDRTFPGFVWQALFVERDVRAEHTATRAVRYSLSRGEEDVVREFLAALIAVDTLCRAVHFEYFLAAGFLVQTVDVLCDHCGELAALFHLREFLVRDVRLDAATVHLLPVVLEKDFRLVVKTTVAQEIFRRVFIELYVVLVIKSVFASEIRDAALGGYPCSSEKDDGLCFVEDLLELLDSFFK